jgi:uncharacterized protein (DUF302 family)
VSSYLDHAYAARRREYTLDVGYDAFTGALLSMIGRTDLRAVDGTGASSWADVRKQLASFVGPSDFSLFQTIDHGNLLSAFAGHTIRAATYVFGNALIAIEMTKHVPTAGLYVPLRLFVQELEPRRVKVVHDVPSDQLSQLGSPEVTAVAESLDTKVEKLIAGALARAKQSSAA